jgi:hypothetical protein
VHELRGLVGLPVVVEGSAEHHVGVAVAVEVPAPATAALNLSFAS